MTNRSRPTKAQTKRARAEAARAAAARAQLRSRQLRAGWWSAAAVVVAALVATTVLVLNRPHTTPPTSALSPSASARGPHQQPTVGRAGRCLRGSRGRRPADARRGGQRGAHPRPPGHHHQRHRRPVPADIGVDDARQKISPLHSHDTTGVIHIESPTKPATFTLGQFFTEWQVSLAADHIGALAADNTHRLKVYVNGSLHDGDPAGIVLAAHDEIAIVYGTDAQQKDPPHTYQWGNGL